MSFYRFLIDGHKRPISISLRITAAAERVAFATAMEPSRDKGELVL
jgi:hypothetical protein